MDEQAFDAITRRLAGTMSRRSALVALAGAMLGVVATTSASRAKDDKVNVCHRDDATGSWSLISIAPEAVKAHRAHGDAIAVDIARDPNHCGSCGSACAATEICVDGKCEIPPPPTPTPTPVPPTPTPTPVPLVALGGECTILGSREECAQVDVAGGPASVVCAQSIAVWPPLDEYQCLMESGSICGYDGPGGSLHPELCVSNTCTISPTDILSRSVC